MSIPGMFAGMVGAGVLPDMSIPAMANDVGLDITIITPKTALATARTRAEVAMRGVPGMRAIEKSSQVRRIVLVQERRLVVVALYNGHRQSPPRESRDCHCPGHTKKPAGARLLNQCRFCISRFPW
jgi:hypothetical protein